MIMTVARRTEVVVVASVTVAVLVARFLLAVRK